MVIWEKLPGHKEIAATESSQGLRDRKWDRISGAGEIKEVIHGCRVTVLEDGKAIEISYTTKCT